MLALAGVLCVLLIPAPSLAVETPVGLEAQGVDPQAALDNRQGLDVRDELGRPVSAEVIRRELKQARAAGAVQAAYASKLPQARKVAWMLEYLSGLATSIAAVFAHDLARFLADVGLPRPPQECPALALVAFTLALVFSSAARAVLCRPVLVPASKRVLRC